MNEWTTGIIYFAFVGFVVPSPHCVDGWSIGLLYVPTFVSVVIRCLAMCTVFIMASAWVSGVVRLLVVLSVSRVASFWVSLVSEKGGEAVFLAGITSCVMGPVRLPDWLFAGQSVGISVGHLA